jgi:hypothetical protein
MSRKGWGTIAYSRREIAMIAKTQIHAIAQQMLERHGSAAIARAGENALTCEQRGEIDEAQEWRHVKEAMKIMQGPHQS